MTMFKPVKIEGKAVLITGANRGVGRALLEEVLGRGAKRVYAATRQPFAHGDRRVTHVPLDVTNAAQVRAAVSKVEALDVLINNAGQSAYDDLSDRVVLDQLLAINLFGTHAVTQAFVPSLSRSGGAVVNTLSALALAPLPVISAYSVSKAAALSLTQAQRALLAGRGISVHAIFTGPVDTDMTKGLEVPKSTPALVAANIVDALERGDEDIFPDPMSQTLASGWRDGVAKGLERQYAPFVSATQVHA
jgi:NAD(P)-dependent dehydrogenase (short-subunit alcohol dehydrogenase family)